MRAASPPNKPRRRRVWMTIAALVTALVIVDGARHTPAPANTGTTWSGTATGPARDGPSWRVATFNIHSGKGLDQRRDLARTATVLPPIDFAVLNEVRGGPWYEEGNQAAALGRRLDMAWLYAPAITQWWQGAFGNAVLSRTAVRRWWQLPLRGNTRAAHRNMTLLALAHPRGTVHVLATHLPRDDQREEQLARVIALYRRLPAPALLMGDLNCTRTAPRLRDLLDEPGVTSAMDHPTVTAPSPLIDWIIVRGLAVEAAGIIETDASDHPCLWATLRWPSEASAG